MANTLSTRIGSALRAERERQRLTLPELAARTGISVSTLSRLENGLRRPDLTLLVPVVRELDVSLDDLVADDRRPVARTFTAHGRVYEPLAHAGPLEVLRVTIRPSSDKPKLNVHGGTEWLYVLAGRLRLRIADQEAVLAPGEAAEFDTRLPHWFGCADDDEVQLLSIFGPEGRRIHVRTRNRVSARASTPSA